MPRDQVPGRWWECPECMRRVFAADRPECLAHAAWRFELGEQPVMREVSNDV